MTKLGEIGLVQTKKAQTNRNRNDEASRNETDEEEVQMGWALHKSCRRKTQFFGRRHMSKSTWSKK